MLARKSGNLKINLNYSDRITANQIPVINSKYTIHYILNRYFDVFELIVGLLRY